MRNALNRAEERIGPSDVSQKKAPVATRAAKAGDIVEILSIGTKAQVISASSDGTLQLQAGIMKGSAKQDEVRVIEGEKPKTVEKGSIAVPMYSEAAKSELDLRGMTAAEAVDTLERFIDAAQMRHINTVTIIHGKGTGALRQAVQQCLKRSHQIKSYRLGRFGEGESGVTIAEIK